MDEALDDLGGDPPFPKVGENVPLVWGCTGQGKGGPFLFCWGRLVRDGGSPRAVTVELQQVADRLPEVLAAEFLQKGDGVPPPSGWNIVSRSGAL